MVFYNELNYDYYFIIKELRKKIEGEFNCLGENTETSKTFSVPITKYVRRIDKNAKEITRTISYKLGFTDNSSLKKNSWSSAAVNYTDWIQKIKCKLNMFMKNLKRVELYTEIVSAVLNTQMLNVI